MLVLVMMLMLLTTSQPCGTGSQQWMWERAVQNISTTLDLELGTDSYFNLSSPTDCLHQFQWIVAAVCFAF